MLFLEIHDFTHNNPRRENGGITARHDRISFLKLHVATKEAELEDIGLNEKSETRILIEKFVDENPEAVAALLRNWLNDDWD